MRCASTNDALRRPFHLVGGRLQTIQEASGPRELSRKKRETEENRYPSGSRQHEQENAKDK